MSILTTGKEVTGFELKNGKTVLIRYPTWSDLKAMTEYINTLSKENTYIVFSGEQMSLEEEADFLAGKFKSIALGNAVVLTAWVKQKLVGICQVDRDTQGRERSKHIGNFGISVAQEFRRQGIGEQLAKATIEEAKQHIRGLRIIVLTQIAQNTSANSLYHKLGFVEYGRLPQGYLYRGDYDDKVYMRLSLAE